ncbi:hypothetical protein [Fundidesulfovibrio terrae]|uniref:hypothetical protein n=1 Tax=Fundidesulfovibrio terrae TaxID=2922866 RepID=UPI001FAE9F5A|nr:hypothetical protein [Fundidesulfovibrio terrae]
MLKKVLIFIVGFSLSVLPVATASERDDLISVRKYCKDFIGKTTRDLQSVFDVWNKTANRAVVMPDNSAEAFAINDISVDVLTLRAFIELAQDVLLASGVEMGIALDLGKKPVIYGDALKRFPGAIPVLADRIISGYGSLPSQELKAAGKEMAPYLKNLVAAFDGWPGSYLREHIGDEPYGKGELSKGMVELATRVDNVNDASVKYFKDMERAEKVAMKNGMDYIYLFRQTQRSITSLSILVPDVYMLLVVGERLQAVGSQKNLSKNDNELIIYYLRGRMARYKEVLDLLDKQCAVLWPDEKAPCTVMVDQFKEMYMQFEANALPLGIQ